MATLTGPGRPFNRLDTTLTRRRWILLHGCSLEKHCEMPPPAIGRSRVSKSKCDFVVAAHRNLSSGMAQWARSYGKPDLSMEHSCRSSSTFRTHGSSDQSASFWPRPGNAYHPFVHNASDRITGLKCNRGARERVMNPHTSLYPQEHAATSLFWGKPFPRHTPPSVDANGIRIAWLGAEDGSVPPVSLSDGS